MNKPVEISFIQNDFVLSTMFYEMFGLTRNHSDDLFPSVSHSDLRILLTDYLFYKGEVWT